jgi:hypothetical protein
MTFTLFKKRPFVYFVDADFARPLVKAGNVYAKYNGTWEIRKKVGSYDNDQERGVYSVETRANAQQIN